MLHLIHNQIQKHFFSFSPGFIKLKFLALPLYTISRLRLFRTRDYAVHIQRVHPFSEVVGFVISGRLRGSTHDEKVKQVTIRIFGMRIKNCIFSSVYFIFYRSE